MDYADEAVKRDGVWDPEVAAYVVEDPSGKQDRYFVWKRPALLVHAGVSFGFIVFWVGLGCVVLADVFGYPEGVAGNRQAQLVQALDDTYRVTLNYVPTRWTDSQVITVDVAQGWDKANYTQPDRTAKGCRLQPGPTAKDLSLQCPDGSGSFGALRRGGGDAEQDYADRKRAEGLPPPQPGQYGFEDYVTGGNDQYDQYDHYQDYEDYWNDYEPPEQDIYP